MALVRSSQCVCVKYFSTKISIICYIKDNTIKDGVKSVSLIYDVSVYLNVIFN